MPVTTVPLQPQDVYINMSQRVEVGTLHNGHFSPVPDPQTLGYWYNNQFYVHDCGHDFSQHPVVYYHNAEWYTLPGVVTYRVGNTFYRTYKEAIAFLNMSTLAVSTIRKRCVLCQSTEAYTVEVFKKVYCVQCLQKRVINGELFFGEGTLRKDWSVQVVCEVLEALYMHLPDNLKRELPVCYPLPLEHFLCYGREEKMGTGGWYPGRPAHISGIRNKCTEESCPNGHDLCKICANTLTHCPQCGSFIPYEEPRPDEEGCTNHCASFTKACLTCGQIAERRKRTN